MFTKNQVSEEPVAKINRLAIVSISLGAMTLFSFLFLITVGQYFEYFLDEMGEYIFLSVPFTGLIGLVTGIAAFIQIKSGDTSQRGIRSAAAGIFLSLTTLIIFILVFLAI